MRRALAAPVSADTPTIKTWQFMGDVLDQGNTGTCTAHAAAHFIHSSPFGHRGYLDPFDLYREIVRVDEYPDNDHEADGDVSKMQTGSSGTGAAKALHKRGLISEYLWAKGLDEIVAWVLLRGPVMIGTNWYAGLGSPTPEGFANISGALRGGHEWLIRGVNLRRGFALAVNSWGPQFNRNATGCRPGHFLLDIDTTLRRLIAEDGDGVSALEVPPVRKPPLPRVRP